MVKMNPRVRLAFCAAIILGSAGYAVLIANDPNVASAVAIGYVAVLLTIFTVVNVWKRP